MLLQILKAPNPLLTEKCKAVDKITPELQQLARHMIQTMKAEKGLGLAAPQVGQLIRLIVLDDPIRDAVPMFNPVIMKRSKELIKLNEGCMSFPDKFIEITRPKDIHMKFRDFNGKMQFAHLKGWMARAAMHEVDHLQGILFDTLVQNEKG